MTDVIQVEANELNLLHQKLDYLTEQIESQRKRQEVWNELVHDMTPAVNDLVKLTIDELDFQVAVGIGETAEGVLTDVEPGTYRFYCTVPGHEVNGMVGELVVTG